MASGHLRAPHQKAEQMAAPTSAAYSPINPLPTGSRPQMARGGLDQSLGVTSAYSLFPE